MLVTEFGVKEHDGIAVVSSRDIARVFGKRHDHVLRDIENIIKDVECQESHSSILGSEKGTVNELFSLFHRHYTSRTSNFIRSTYKSDRGRREPEYLMTRSGATFLTMGFTGPKADEFKWAYIDQFEQMEAQILQREKMRLEWTAFTDAIKYSKPNRKPHHYSNESDMINRIVLGMSAKQFRLMNNIPKNDPIRPHFTEEQSYFWDMLQAIDTGLLHAGLDFKARQFKLSEVYTQKLIAYREKKQKKIDAGKVH
jgi:phage regulator Rha-like protein